MFFVASKIFTFLCQPSSLSVILLTAGLVLAGRTDTHTLGLRMAWAGLTAIVILGLLPVGNAIILPLEERFASVAPPQATDRVTGIIILGGFEDGWVSGGRGGLAINEASERLTEGLRLGLAFPDAKVVFTGGVGGIRGLGGPWSAGDAATGPVSDFLIAAGIARDRVILEGKSRNTHENAQFLAEMIKPDSSQKWVLVTSAYHMPRSVALFRKAGFNVWPYPVDYRTRSREDLTRIFERIPAGLQRTDLAVTEWIGLLAYRLTGRIDALFPRP